MRKDFTEQNIWSIIVGKNSEDPTHLSRIALIDCTREYTYSQMFTEWERYARVFSALGMTGERKARVAIGGTISAEPLFSFYGLNMTGAEVSMFSYPDFLPGGQWKNMIRAEKITDLILSDIMVSDELLSELQREREALGLKNVILLHSKLGGPCTGPAELTFNEFNYHRLRRKSGTVFMGDLLRKYASSAIQYADVGPDHIAVITHTSGTTKGTRKPLPYTVRAINRLYSLEVKTVHEVCGKEQIRIAPSFDFSSFLSFAGAVNANFVFGDTVVLTFFGFMHPKFIRAVAYYGLDAILSSGFMLDKWMERNDIDDLDLSGVTMITCGGSYVSTEKLQKYNSFLQKHGFKGSVSRGYGMSETGGAELYVPSGCNDDILGYPRPEEDFLIFDESDKCYHKASDGERTGILYMTSPTMCLNVLDGEKLFDFTKIEGRNFICTNDMVVVNSDHSLTYAGRADRYFANNDGVRFDPGIVETAVAGQKEIDRCAVVPVLDKRIHDTVPVLYVIPSAEEKDPVRAVTSALVNAFTKSDVLQDSNLPTQFVIVDDIPCNANGKIDIYRITRDRLNGEVYNLIPVKTDGRLTDIKAEYADRVSSIKAGTLPEGMDGRSAMGMFELFNMPEKKNKTPDFLNPFGFFKHRSVKETE